MKAKQVHGDPKTFVVVLATDEEASEQLLAFAKQYRPGSASFTGIGAFQKCVLGYFDWYEKRYLENPIDDQVEVLSLVGNLSWVKDEPKLHAHVVVGRRDGTAHGGHLLKGWVRPTLEVVLVESPAHLQRQLDPQSKIPLIRLDASQPGKEQP
ncbi:MAG TPA: PPC domain-containing DNA-binding protein [Pirellulales bacterium]|nr:PPC domain-containing DNA-binding protein [Pirellulales bacterium]